MDGGGDRHRARIRAAAAERSDAAGRLVQALEAGDDRDLVVALHAADDLGAVDRFDAGGPVRVGRDDRDLPALPGAGGKAHFLQHHGQEAGGDLLAGGDDRVIFRAVHERGGLAAPVDELVGPPRHGRDDDGDLAARLDLALHVQRDVADALEIGDGRAAEFHDEARHGRI